jgi:hypothetical protein
MFYNSAELVLQTRLRSSFFKRANDFWRGPQQPEAAKSEYERWKIIPSTGGGNDEHPRRWGVPFVSSPDW